MSALLGTSSGSPVGRAADLRVGSDPIPTLPTPMTRVTLAACLAVLCALAAPTALAQSALWSDVSETSVTPSKARVTTPQAYRVVQLDEAQMRDRLAGAPAERRIGDTTPGAALTIPLPEGGLATVRVVESSILAPALQARYPEIRTYLASGSGVHGRLSLTPAGFQGLLFTTRCAVYVDAYAPGETEHYIVYRASDLIVAPALRGREADEVRRATRQAPTGPAARPNGETLRTYRLAVAATGEYTQFHGGTKAAAMTAITTTMNRVTGIYERDFSVRFELVANNDDVVFTNGTTDPYSNNNGFAMLSQNIATLNALIGSGNFDVGHVFSTGGGGVAYLGVICSAQKAGGVTGRGAPVGDAFDVDYVAHEIGHQLRMLMKRKPDLDIRLLIWKSPLLIAASQGFYPHRAQRSFRKRMVEFLKERLA